MKTVRQLRRRLPDAESVVWEEKLDPRSEMSTTTVFRKLADDQVETYVREWGVPIYRQIWESEEAAVDAVGGRLLGTRPQTRTARTYEGPPPTTVEDLKDALADLGLDPDQVTRKELLHWAGAGDDVTILESHENGSVRTFYRERGADKHAQDWPDEASAIADLTWEVEQGQGRAASDLEVERMRARARRMRVMHERYRRGQEPIGE